MKIYIRADSSTIIGTGHVMRMLHLASYLGDHNITFISKNFKGNIIYKIKEKYECKEIFFDNNKIILDQSKEDNWLGEDINIDLQKTIDIIKYDNIDLLIIDNYAINYVWEKSIKKYVRKIFVVDDYSNRNHYCDYYLNYHYDNVSFDWCNTTLFLGYDYFIINPDFVKWKNKKYFNKKKIINISFGGSDIHSLTEKILDEIYSTNYIFNLIIGTSNTKYEYIKQKYNMDNVVIYHNIDNVAEVLSYADICIGAGGIMLYETLFLEKPILVVTTANNQIELTKKLADNNYLVYCGHYTGNYLDKIKINLEQQLILNTLSFHNNIKDITSKLNLN